MFSPSRTWRDRHGTLGSISLEDGRLHLYSLQAEALPSGAVTLQMGEVVSAFTACEVFLDLSWPGCRAARRVVVRLPWDTARGRLFLMLCSGQWGPCYANTRLFKVEYKGQLRECVREGNYQAANASGATLLSYFSFRGYCESAPSLWVAGNSSSVPLSSPEKWGGLASEKTSGCKNVLPKSKRRISNMATHAANRESQPLPKQDKGYRINMDGCS